MASRGCPGIRVRSEQFNYTLTETALPATIGRISDFAPVEAENRSLWLLLEENGWISRLDVDSGDLVALGRTTLTTEADRRPWNGRVLRRRLHSSKSGDFAAVVNDYGRYGQIIDLRTGSVTVTLDGGDYHAETVPFSFAFAEGCGNRVLAIHRTAWNRLDISDAATGELLSYREPTSYKSGESQPEHYLDYFHGALYPSPSGENILDDGWIWHPAGVPSVWSIGSWLSDNVWESEDGPTRKDLCLRDYYWDHPMCWIDDRRVVIGGIGEDDQYIADGARVFDISRLPLKHCGFSYEDLGLEPGEVLMFPGPAGRFFSDGGWLFSADNTGLSRWDAETGEKSGSLAGLSPTHYHQGANELV